MSETVLLRFLGSGLVDVGGDDAKLGKLQATSAAVAVALKEHPSKVPNYSLVAFDSNAPIGDPVIVEVLTTLKELWPTYVNTFASTPVTVLRAIILDALLAAAREDERVAIAFSASARNILPFMETGNELSIWVDVVSEIETAVDNRAEKEWTTPEHITLGQFELKPPGAIKIVSGSGKVDREALRTKLTAGAGGNSNGNPHWPQNQPAAWAQSMGSTFAEAIGQAIDEVASQSKAGSVDLSAPMQQLASGVSAYVSEALLAFSEATAGLQRRTNLIWWKQALFSPSKRMNYRALPLTIASALMALDLYQQIPMFSPASVSAFLEEAVLSLSAPLTTKERSLKDILMEACESPALDVVRSEAARLFASPVGRSPVLAIIGHPETCSSFKDSDLRRIIGLSLDIQVSDARWASWLFRDLQAGRSTKDQAKKRGSKGKV